MGFFDKKPKKDSGLFGSKYEPDAWRKDIPYNDTHDSHIWDWDDYNMRGVELAKKLRKQLSQDFDLWYEPPFEDSSENKKTTLILS